VAFKKLLQDYVLVATYINEEKLNNFLQELTKERALKILQDAGIIDENGELTKPYQPEPNPEIMHGTDPDLHMKIQEKVEPPLQPKTIYTVLKVIADEVERRGEKGLDLDPGETSDWLRREAELCIEWI
jgi:hypothetical protein